MARFDRSIALAKRLIKKDGHIVTWRQIPDTTPTDPWSTPDPTPIDHDVYMCFIPYTHTEQYLNLISRMKDGETPQKTISGLLAAVPFIPSIKDVIIHDGVEMRIDNIEPLNPNGQDIMYVVEFYA